ncbi:MAG: dolichyl-phosphate mannose synthase [Planctomycetales bacterium 12-60-4]|nr:MAG: dolichyl-phosphate mannose synthase [Planctomycetales bacterium 12-60-4]
MTRRVLTALPVFNEVRHVGPVLDKVVQYSEDVLVVDDGSSDGTSELLAARSDVIWRRHEQNQGYGAALRTAYDFALEHAYDVLVTIDCDGQHEPKLIPEMAATVFRDPESPVDIVSGSRYLQVFDGDSLPPADRRRINLEITAWLNGRFRLNITDAFCGFKAYRVPALEHLHITDLGYAMPLQVWVQAARYCLKIEEFPVPLIYLDEERSFGGALDDAHRRLTHYYSVLHREIAALEFPCGETVREIASA